MHSFVCYLEKPTLQYKAPCIGFQNKRVPPKMADRYTQNQCLQIIVDPFYMSEQWILWFELTKSITCDAIWSSQDSHVEILLIKVAIKDFTLCSGKSKFSGCYLLLSLQTQMKGNGWEICCLPLCSVI